MSRVLLVHWDREEAVERIARLRAAGFNAEHLDLRAGAADLRGLGRPSAVVIDLTRLPSHGRAVGVALRQQKATRDVPLVFIEGDAAKTRKVREQLPDATFVSWARIGTSLRRAIDTPQVAPLVPGTMDAYSSTPLPRKLGIKPGVVVALLNAPEQFERQLGRCEARIKRHARGAAGLIMLFVRSQAELRKRLPTAERILVEGGSIWIAWPKQASGVRTDLTQACVRSFSLARGLVDFKICAIDETWSGLRFVRRRAPRK